MKPYLISLGAGILVGLIYSLLGVRSPAPPVVALVGLFGILLGEQAVPILKTVLAGAPALAYLRKDAAEHVLGPHVRKASKAPEPGQTE
jgi:XapX domain-containing protein